VFWSCQGFILPQGIQIVLGGCIKLVLQDTQFGKKQNKKFTLLSTTSS